jgi:hypothetical protein
LQSAAQILITGNFTIKVPNREELLSVKAAKKEYDELLKLASDLMVLIEKHYQTSTLPERLDEQKAIGILVKIREELDGGENRVKSIE